MDTVAVVDHILQVLGNLGGIFEFVNNKVYPYVEENQWRIALGLVILLVIAILLNKGPGPAAI